MSFDVDRQEVADAVARGDVEWLWSALQGAYADLAAARAELAGWRERTDADMDAYLDAATWGAREEMHRRALATLATERERCERLRKALLDACDGVDHASHLLEAAGAVVRALGALHPGDLDGEKP